MAPLAPKALEALRAEFEQVKSHNPLLGDLVKLRGIPRLLGLNDGLIYPPEEGASLNFVSAQALRKAPLHGPIKALVVLVEFPNTRFQAGFTKEHFEKLFFSSGGTPVEPSVNDFYRQASNGNISLTGEVVGPYCMPYDLNYYANHKSGMSAQEPSTRTLGQHAAEAVNRDDNLGPLTSFDNNGDSYMDAFIVIHAGPGAESIRDATRSENIWSVKWNTPNPYNTHGAYVYSFLTVPEDSRVGVCAHEVGHLIFGWPDLYDTDYTSEGLGNWCLMAGGSWNSINGIPGTLPCEPSAWCKAAQGWVNVVNVSSLLLQQGGAGGLQGSTALQIMDVKKGSRDVFRLDIKRDGSEYILMENRQREGLDGGMPGAGLLMYHVDETVAGNSDDWHPKVMLIQADGYSHLNRSDQYRNRGDVGDPFPGSARVTTISDDTTPSTRSYYQGRRSGISISYISNPGELMTCQVSLALVAAAPAMSAGGGEVPAAAVRPQAALIPELVPPVVPAGLTGTTVAAATVPATLGPANNPAGQLQQQLLELLIAKERREEAVMTRLVQLLEHLVTTPR